MVVVCITDTAMAKKRALDGRVYQVPSPSPSPRPSRTPGISYSRPLALPYSRTLALPHSRTPILPHSLPQALENLGGNPVSDVHTGPDVIGYRNPFVFVGAKGLDEGEAQARWGH